MTNRRKLNYNSFDNSINSAYQKILQDKTLGVNLIMKIIGDEGGIDKNETPNETPIGVSGKRININENVLFEES